MSLPHLSPAPLSLCVQGIYLINSNMAFNALWGVIRLMLPRRLTSATYLLPKASASRMLCEHLGYHQVYTCTIPSLSFGTLLGLAQSYRICLTLYTCKRHSPPAADPPPMAPPAGANVRRRRARGAGRRARVLAGLVLGTAGRTGTTGAARFPAVPTAAAAVIPFDVAFKATLPSSLFNSQAIFLPDASALSQLSIFCSRSTSTRPSLHARAARATSLRRGPALFRCVVVSLCCWQGGTLVLFLHISVDVRFFFLMCGVWSVWLGEH